MNTDVENAPEILAFSTKGTGSNEENRIRELTRNFSTEFIPFDKQRKWKSFRGIIQRFAMCRKKLVVMEGTGVFGGFACLVGRLLWGHRYVVSSGDAVGPFVGSLSLIAGPVFAVYERLLCRFASGFIGWTPYLVGRALTFGTPRAITAPGWVLGDDEAPIEKKSRQDVRSAWNVPGDAIVFGIAGAIIWNRRRKYCYGLELVRAVKRVKRDDIAVVIVGTGSGIAYLEEEAGDLIGRKVFLPGSVPLAEVMNQLGAMDVGSLPQSTDGVGVFRYTTKISEYRRACLPIATNRIPAAYDLDQGQIWRLPGSSPWDPVFIDAMVELMDQVSPESLLKVKESYSTSEERVFLKDEQVRKTTCFIRELLEELGVRK